MSIFSIAPAIAKANETPQAHVRSFALEHNVSPELLDYVVSHESHYNSSEIGDLYITCKSGPYKGKSVYARGPLQITRCYHPDITDAQAFDLDWSLAWALPYLQDKQKCIGMWTTCRMYYE